MEQEIEIEIVVVEERYIGRECGRGMKRKIEEIKQLMKKNENECEKYQRRDAWTRCQVTIL